ncbi:MAG: septum formation initiator family protein [Candidatus Omnitrophica bacterium]|nr:septum formation initiator family protein [Candidatus Omnitrophota bacterium]
MLRNPLWLFAFAMLILAFFLPSYTQMQDLKARNDDYAQQIADLTKKNKDLKEEKRLLINDPDYFEKVARERMGLVKENEVIYKFVPQEHMDAVKAAAAAAAEKQMNAVKLLNEVKD